MIKNTKTLNITNFSQYDGIHLYYFIKFIIFFFFAIYKMSENNSNSNNLKESQWLDDMWAGDPKLVS